MRGSVPFRGAGLKSLRGAKHFQGGGGQCYSHCRMVLICYPIVLLAFHSTGEGIKHAEDKSKSNERGQ